MTTHNIGDMPPQEIRIALLRRGVSQSGIARDLGVKPASVLKVIEGHLVSHRIREAISLAIGIDLKLLWPSTYLYGPGQRKRGRPFGSGTKKAA